LFSGFDVLSLDLGLGLGTPESRFQSFDSLSVCLGLSLEQRVLNPSLPAIQSCMVLRYICTVGRFNRARVP